MISTVTSTYREDIEQSLDINIRATITNVGGTPTSRVVLNDNIIDRGFSFTDSNSQEGLLEIGSSIVNQLTLTIDNPPEYNDFKYAGAKVVLEIGRLIDGFVEYFQKGIYYVITDGYYTNTVTLTCYDSMILLDVPFDSTLYYDDEGNFNTCTLLNLWTDFLQQANVTCYYVPVKASLEIKNVDGLDNITLRQLLYYICQIECCYARFNPLGELELKWHKFGISKDDTDIDVTVYVVDSYRKADYITINGVKISNISNRKDYQTASTGSYLLVVDGNPLITKGYTGEVADYIATKIVNKKMRPLNCRIAPNELLEVGDKVLVVNDTWASAVVICITDISYVIGEPMYISCGAESKEQNLTNRGISQIERNLKKVQNITQGVQSIEQTKDASGKITSLKYVFDDDTYSTIGITYDSNGKITMIGGTAIT